MSADIANGPVCPVPLPHNRQIILGHGSGGQLTHQLIQNVFQKYLTNPYLEQGDDSANLPVDPAAGKIALTTDSHIVSPLFFPGGDIGRLAVCGTVNDLVMIGAKPLYLTAGFILEEGLEIDLLEKVLASMSEAAKEADVSIVAGDTKVVEKGKADQIFINTSGYGVIPSERDGISGASARPGDDIIVSGFMGDHGIAVMAARNDLAFEIQVSSDVAPLNHLAKALFTAGIKIHVLRDPTRGGLGTTLNEIACQSQVSLHIHEDQIPVRPAVQSACEMLGFDPLYVANEGKMIIIAPNAQTAKILDILHNHPYGRDAVRIGSVEPERPGKVILHTLYGSTRLVPMLSGELLPRIC
jgi:hydrogenase expression/formation protein HypE